MSPPCSENIHHRRPIRLQGYDYSAAGMYFVTLCAKDRAYLFGNIVDGKMYLNNVGKIAVKCWGDIPSHFSHITLDQFIIMPNHVHGIISVTGVSGNVGAKNFSPNSGTARTIGSIVRGFKIGVTKWMRAHTTIHEVWQRNYWERIIRNEDELTSIREYIQNNPAQWENDKLYVPQTDVVEGEAGAKNFSPLQPWEGM
jgi:REP element-mobilizing transposase RayT